MIDYDSYITEEEYKIAEANGIDKRTLEDRIRRQFWDKKRAISQPKRERGKYMEWYKVAESNGISRGTFIARVNESGWSCERAATEPIKSVKEKAIIMAECRKKYPDEVYATLKANGISKNTFVGRIHRGWSVERAITEKVDIKRSNKIRDTKEMHPKT